MDVEKMSSQLESLVRESIDRSMNDYVLNLVKVYMATSGQPDDGERFVNGLRKMKQSHADLMELIAKGLI